MSSRLADRAAHLKPSVTLGLNAKANALRAAGRDIVNMGVGEPDFDTPQAIREAGKRAIDGGKTRYTAVDGIVELKEAVCDKLKRDNGLEYKPNQVIISNGAKQSLFNLCQVVLNPGDEAIIPAPYWVSYPAMVEIASAKPVFIATTAEQRYKISAEQLEQAITNKTKLLFINSPSNPSGMIYQKEELAALAEVLRKHPQILIATDDMYEKIRWNNIEFKNILNADSSLYERTIVFNGLSKSHAMTGWRMGYAAGPEDIIGAMKKIQSQSTSNPSSITQYASLVALGPEGDNEMTSMVESFKQRHDALHAQLSQLPGFSCLQSDGTFYLFPNIEQAIAQKGLASDVEFAEQLLEAQGVAVVPGSAFGAPGHLRFSCAVSLEQIETAVQRISAFIAS